MSCVVRPLILGVVCCLVWRCVLFRVRCLLSLCVVFDACVFSFVVCRLSIAVICIWLLYVLFVDFVCWLRLVVVARGCSQFDRVGPFAFVVCCG